MEGHKKGEAMWHDKYTNLLQKWVWRGSVDVRACLTHAPGSNSFSPTPPPHTHTLSFTQVRQGYAGGASGGTGPASRGTGAGRLPGHEDCGD